MKKHFIFSCLLLAAGARANIITNFFADFEGAAKNTQITAANRLTTIEPGTAIGSWEILNSRPQTRVKDTAAGAALQMRTGFYHFKGHLDGAIDLAETPAAIGFDFRVGADTGATDWTMFRVQNNANQNIASFRLRNGPAQVYDYSLASPAWTDVPAEAFTPLAFSDDLADGLMDALEIRIEGAQTTYYANGSQIYAHASSVNAHSVATFDIYTTSGTASTWYDNISVAAIPEPATLGLLGMSAALVWGIRRYGSLG